MSYPINPDSTPLLTVPECAARLRTGTAQIYQAIRQQKIPYLRLGRKYLLDWSAVRAALEARPLNPES